MKIQIGAEVGGALSGLQAVANSFKVVEVGSQKTGLAILNLQQKVQQFGGGVSRFVPPAISNFNRLPQAVNAAAPAFSKFSNSSNQATNALSNLSRVAQDAPYGFIGIANNLNPLLESFQRLRATTGSTGAALRALGASLSGPAGIGLALGVVSSLAVAFGDKLSGLGSSAEEASEAAKKLSDSINGVYSEVAKEAASVNSFIAVLKSETETRERKLASIKELQKIQPDIFKGLKLEGDAVVGLDNAYKNYLANLKNVIQAKVIQVQLEQKIEQLMKTQALNLGTTNFLKGFTGITDKDGKKLFSGLDVGAKFTTSNVEKEIEALFQDLVKYSKNIEVPLKVDAKGNKTDLIAKAKELSDAFKGLIDISFEVNELDSAKEQLEKAKSFLSKFSKDEFNILIDPELTLNETELRKQNELILRKIGAGFIVKGITTPPIPIDPQFQIEEGYVKKEVEKRFKDIGAKLENVTWEIKGADILIKDFDLKIDGEKIKVNVPITPKITLSKDAQANADALAAAKKLSEDVAKTISESLAGLAVDSISALAEGLGEALATGDLSKGFRAFASVIANGFMSIGKQMIAAAPVIKALKAAIDTLNPGLLLPAGIALVAIGSALRATMSKGIPGRAIGGRVNKGEPYIVGEVGREMFVPDTSGRILPNSALNSGRASIGAGSMVVQIVGEFIQRGADMVATISQVNRSQNRLV